MTTQTTSRKQQPRAKITKMRDGLLQAAREYEGARDENSNEEGRLRKNLNSRCRRIIRDQRYYGKFIRDQGFYGKFTDEECVVLTEAVHTTLRILWNMEDIQFVEDLG